MESTYFLSVRKTTNTFTLKKLLIEEGKKKNQGKYSND